MRLTKVVNKGMNKTPIYVGSYGNIVNIGDNQATSMVHHKLGKLEDIEDELGVDLITLFKALKDGIYAKAGKFHKQVYLCFIDGEWTIADMQTDCWYLVSEYGKTWALSKDELNK